MMEYRLRAMELWFQHLPGSFLLQLETKALSQWFSRWTGRHCLQIGGPSDLKLVKAAHYPYKTYLSTQFLSSTHSSRIQSSLEDLPLMTNSLDAVVLVHLLEFSNQPLQLLQEIYRALAPEGYLLLLSFNPWSLWGLTRVKHNKRGFPWSGNFHTYSNTKAWLREAGFCIVARETLCFQPPAYSIHHRQRWSFLESLGPYCFPGLGSVSLIIAQKKEVGMTPLVSKARRSRVRVRGGVIEPTTRVS